MKSISPTPPESSRPGLRLLGLALLAGLLAALIAIVRPSPTPPPAPQTDPAATPMTVTHSGRGLGKATPVREFKPTPTRPAEEVVAEKLSLFTSNRAALVTAMANDLNLEVPPEVTRFFAAKTREPLGVKFLPIVTKATEKVKLADKYNAVAGRAARLGLLGKEESNVQEYVTGKALDGLYLMIGEEERKIRRNPVATGSAILKKVFGSLK